MVVRQSLNFFKSHFPACIDFIQQHDSSYIGFGLTKFTNAYCLCL